MGKRRLIQLAGLAGLVLAVIVVALVVVRQRGGPLPDGPVAIDWDHETCTRCRMPLSRPGFAAQLHTAEGQVLNYDDPGCLLANQFERGLEAEAVYFHHMATDRWLSSSEVAFVPVDDSPMGYRLGAVEAGTPGSLTLEAARERVLRREGVLDPAAR